jgi:hypothetical protein
MVGNAEVIVISRGISTRQFRLEKRDWGWPPAGQDNRELDHRPQNPVSGSDACIWSRWMVAAMLLPPVDHRRDMIL